MKCQNGDCKHKATEVPWIGLGSVLDLIHGNYTYWCECCMVKAQLEHAEKLAARIPKLKAELETACQQTSMVLPYVWAGS